MFEEEFIDEISLDESEEDDFYSDTFREDELVENGEIDPRESGFMQGWKRGLES